MEADRPAISEEKAYLLIVVILKAVFPEWKVEWGGKGYLSP